MTSSKNILHLTGMDSTKYGGLERFNVELATQLHDMGYHSVFVYETWPDVEQFVQDLKKVDAEVIVINSRTNPLRFCRQLWSLFKKYHFCMMHAHFTKARFYAIPLAIVYGIKNIVYTFHSRVPPLCEMKLHTRLWYKLVNPYCRVVAVSKQIESVAKTNWPNLKVVCRYQGTEPIKGDKLKYRKELGIDKDELMVMCTANFNHIKGLDILVRSVKQLSDKLDLNHISFYIVGQPEKDRKELKPLIDELSLSAYIHMEGISNEVYKYLSAADVYIQPSRSEGIGVALMEAASARLPLIAANIGGMPEVAHNGENAILFESENIEDCANALYTLLTDKELREKYGERSYCVYEENFRVKERVTNLIEYYRL